VTRGSVLGSGLVHIALLVVLFIVRGPTSMVIPGPDVVQVSLLDPTAPTAPVAPPEPETKPEPKASEIKPEQDTGVKLEPVKPKPKAKEPEKKAEPSTTTPALPSAPAGNSGLSGQLSLDASNFEFTYYLVLVRNKIVQNWTPPTGLASSGQPVKATVYFKILRGGEIAAARLETSSGVEFFDSTALRSVVISDPLPPLPLGFAGSELGVHFEFLWREP